MRAIETSRTWAEIDIENIKHNVRAIKAAMPAGTSFLGVVKADAYGHGAVPAAKAILEAGGDYLAVACISEAAELREAGITAPILILGITPPDFASRLVDLGVTQSVSSYAYGLALAERLEGRLKCHLKIDSGMGRLGFSCWDEGLVDIIKTLELDKLDFEGVFTHFALSDCPGEDFTAEQYRRFSGIVRKAEEKSGHRFALKHCANSGAVINFREYAMDMVRPGLMTYGMYPEKETGGIELRPAMSLKSRVYAITEHRAGDTISYGRTYTVEGDSRLAVVPIGYADGLSRSLSGRLDVLIRGRRCRQVGRICMDMCMVDITSLPDCQEGDIVTIIGTDGDEVITATELAEKQGSINYEVTCDVAPRVPRVYL